MERSHACSFSCIHVRCYYVRMARRLFMLAEVPEFRESVSAVSNFCVIVSLSLSLCRSVCSGLGAG